MKKNDQIRALIDAYTELAECSGCSERSTMLALFDIFGSDELAELGYAERVKAYNEEYGCDENEKEYTQEALKKAVLPKLLDQLARLFPSYHYSFPEDFIDGIIEDVYDSSDWQTKGQYSDDDISLAIQRAILQSIGMIV